MTATIIDFGLSRLTLDGGVKWTPLPEEVYDGVGAQWDVYRAMRDAIESRPPPRSRALTPTPPPAGPAVRKRRPRRTTARVVQYTVSDSDSDADLPDAAHVSPPPPSSSASTAQSSVPSAARAAAPPAQVPAPAPDDGPWTAFVPASNVLWLRYLCAYLLKAARKPYGRRAASAAKEAARQRQEAAWGMLCDVGAALDPAMGMFESAADVRAWGGECGWVAS